MECVVKLEYEEVEMKEEISSIFIKSEYEECTVTEPTSKPISLVIDPIGTKTPNTKQSELNSVVENVVKSEYNRSEFEQTISSFDFNSECTEDRTTAIEPTREPISKSNNLVTIKINNTNPSEHYNMIENVEKYQNNETEPKREISSVDYNLKYTEGKYTVAETLSERISMVTDSVSTSKINIQNTDSSDGYNNVEIHNADVELKTLVSGQRNSTYKHYSCDVCTKAFAHKGSLKRHMLTHTGGKSFSSRVCTKAFASRSNLKRHMFIHTIGKPYMCDVCTKAFSRRSLLERHILIHTGDKSFSCDICSKVFTYKSSLKTHMLIHTGDKPYSCDVCTKAFAHKNSYKSHMRIHTRDKYLCRVCTKEFPNATNLKRHMFIHTGVKNFSCDVCSKVYIHSSTFKTHNMLFHT